MEAQFVLRGYDCDIPRTIVLPQGTSVTKQPQTRHRPNHTRWIFMQGHEVFKYLGGALGQRGYIDLQFVLRGTQNYSQD